MRRKGYLEERIYGISGLRRPTNIYGLDRDADLSPMAFEILREIPSTEILKSRLDS
jgi:hypothetical protein